MKLLYVISAISTLFTVSAFAQDARHSSFQKDLERSNWPKEAACGGGKIVLSAPLDKVKPTWFKSDGKSEVVYNGKFSSSAIAACGSGVVTVFDDGTNWAMNEWAYYSPSCKAIGGGNNTVNVYNGNHAIEALYPHESGQGVIAAWKDPNNGITSVYHSPDCYNLGGGGNTKKLQ